MPVNCACFEIVLYLKVTLFRIIKHMISVFENYLDTYKIYIGIPTAGGAVVQWNVVDCLTTLSASQ